MINVDASFNHDNLSGGIGAAIRDDTGRFIAACNIEPIAFGIDASTLETKAISRGLALANEVG